MSEILKDARLGDLVTASTVHRFQGDEKQIQADRMDDEGPKLLNVAISRTQEYLVVLANLAYLDAKLPSHAMLRSYLHEMQRRGTIVDAHDILALRPITEDLQNHGADVAVEWDAAGWGVFRQKTFDPSSSVILRARRPSRRRGRRRARSGALTGTRRVGPCAPLGYRQHQ